MPYISPTGYNDSGNQWDMELRAYDGNTGSGTTCSMPPQTWSSYLELTISSILCSHIRFFAGISSYPEVNQIDIDLYYSGSWHDLYQGSFAFQTWVTKTIGSNQNVTKMRIRLYNSSSSIYRGGYLWEAEFFGVTVVTTQAVTDITHNTSTGNGNITARGGENCTKRGVCWNTTGSPTVADSKSEETGSFGIGAFTRPMTGLDPNVKYYVRAYAYNSDGYTYGSQVDFTTDKTTPTVTVQDSTNVLPTTVTANGNITATGGENCTIRGFKYGLTKTNTWDAHDEGDFGVGAYTKGLIDLIANTTYWIRAYATNSIGTSYSAWIQFQTAAPGGTPLGTMVSVCSDYSGYTYKLNSAFLDDGDGYESYFVLSTDLAQKQGLHINKRLEDLFLYFMKKESGTAKIYIKRDNEADWQYAGEISMTGDEDIVIKHLPSENEDSSGDVDFLAKHFLIKFVFENDFGFIGIITESIPIGAR